MFSSRFQFCRLNLGDINKKRLNLRIEKYKNKYIVPFEKQKLYALL